MPQALPAPALTYRILPRGPSSVPSFPRPAPVIPFPAQRARRHHRAPVARRGALPLVEHIASLSVGGAIGTTMQNVARSMGAGPLMATGLVVGGAYMLGRDAPAHSMTDKVTDGMIASVGSQAVFQLIDWWKSRGTANPDQLIEQLKNLTPEQKAKLAAALKSTP